jgi:ribonuclease BN (tRNA processing enzyme)
MKELLASDQSANWEAFMMRSILGCLLFALSAASSATAQTCAGNPVAVQVLGSGGPTFNAQRASASYLLWIGPQAKLLFDIGGGAHLRFSQAGAKLADLAMVGISHLHPDHTSDLPALMWASNRARSAPLPMVGPSGNNVAPDFKTFLARLFDEKTGAFQVLGSTLAAERPGVERPRIEATVVDVGKTEPTGVFEGDGITVTAQRIPHANLPTLAYRVQTRDKSVVFSSDQNGSDPKFVDFAKGADVLVMHMAIAANAPPNPRHASPAVVGRIAQDAGAKRLVLGHIGQFDLDAAVADVKKSFTGALTVGADLQCTPVL